MKIIKYAGGGINYLPSSNPQTTTEGVSSETSSSKSKVPGFADKLIDMIKTDGLDSDVNVFLKKVSNTLDLANDPTGENISLNEIIKLTRDAKRVKSNYEDYSKARENLNAQQAWADMAMDSRGNLYIFDSETKKIKTVSLSEYTNNKDNYLVLTNEELLSQRRTNTTLAYNNSILDDIFGAVGMKTIVDYTSDLLKNFKDTEVEGYAVKNKSIQTGLNEIINGVLSNGNSLSSAIKSGPDGVYKISEKSTSADTNLQGALAYLVNAMPTKYKKTLEARAAIEGFSPEAFLLSMIETNTGRKLEINFDSSASKGSSGNTGEGGQVQHSLAEAYVDGQDLPGLPTWLEISPSDSTSSLVVYGQNAGPILKDNSGNPGNPIGVANVAQIFEDSYGIRKISSNTVVFGDQLIKDDQIGGLVYDGSDLHRVIMPCKVINGGRDKVPDFELQDKLDNIVKAAVDRGSDEETISRLINEVCPGAKYDSSTGGIILPSDKRGIFLTFGAMAASNFIDFDTDSKYLSKNNRDNVEEYEEAVKYGYANHKKNDQERISGTSDAGFMGTWFGRTGRNLYRGNVFIPITSIAAGSAMYNQEYIPKSSYTNVTGRAIETERQRQIREKLSDSSNLNW